MTHVAREKLIQFIKVNDITYNYSAVDFNYYSDGDLLALKKRLEEKPKPSIMDNWRQLHKTVKRSGERSFRKWENKTVLVHLNWIRG